MEKTPKQIEDDERRAEGEFSTATGVRQADAENARKEAEFAKQAARKASAPTTKTPDERSGQPISVEAKVDHLQTSILTGFDLLGQALAIEVKGVQNKLLADGGGAANAGPDTKANIQLLEDMLNRFKATVETLKKGAVGHQRRQEDLKSDRV